MAERMSGRLERRLGASDKQQQRLERRLCDLASSLEVLEGEQRAQGRQLELLEELLQSLQAQRGQLGLLGELLQGLQAQRGQTESECLRRLADVEDDQRALAAATSSAVAQGEEVQQRCFERLRPLEDRLCALEDDRQLLQSEGNLEERIEALEAQRDLCEQASALHAGAEGAQALANVGRLEAKLLEELKEVRAQCAIMKPGAAAGADASAGGPGSLKSLELEARLAACEGACETLRVQIAQGSAELAQAARVGLGDAKAHLDAVLAQVAGLGDRVRRLEEGSQQTGAITNLLKQALLATQRGLADVKRSIDLAIVERKTGIHGSGGYSQRSGASSEQGQPASVLAPAAAHTAGLAVRLAGLEEGLSRASEVSLALRREVAQLETWTSSRVSELAARIDAVGTANQEASALQWPAHGGDVSGDKGALDQAEAILHMVGNIVLRQQRELANVSAGLRLQCSNFAVQKGPGAAVCMQRSLAEAALDTAAGDEVKADSEEQHAAGAGAGVGASAVAQSPAARLITPSELVPARPLRSDQQPEKEMEAWSHNLRKSTPWSALAHLSAALGGFEAVLESAENCQVGDGHKAPAGVNPVPSASRTATPTRPARLAQASPLEPIGGGAALAETTASSSATIEPPLSGNRSGRSDTDWEGRAT